MKDCWHEVPLHVLDEVMGTFLRCTKEKQGNLEPPATNEKRRRAGIGKTIII